MTMTACGSDNNSAPSSSAASGSASAAAADCGGKNALTAEGSTAQQNAIAEFNKANPKIRVRIALTPWDSYWTKLQTSIAGGAPYVILNYELEYVRPAPGGAAPPPAKPARATKKPKA